MKIDSVVDSVRSDGRSDLSSFGCLILRFKNNHSLIYLTTPLKTAGNRLGAIHRQRYDLEGN